MGDIKELTNDELLAGIENIGKNHERVKKEILVLVEVLNEIENQYLELAQELKNRT